ncbi:MAG: hypothetical protein A3D74_03960 [Candidatus Levybacteria bacterium RIFCSPHIGHO2_02_FULL_37_13]|nr:MAG: hypothetical protein A3D74_03960 [Candidatus Levybacteria bacterium RIFCSPHIGHO2_02_FULL_37_13]OGH39604.1 MAG: hypothetical protein A3B41_01970 [Candidatus Levybacteria bacterium RIFCSPLOWO2_01_FULL_37_26]
MKKIILEKLFACPRCQTYLQNVKTSKGKCKKCGFTYKKTGNIWHFLHSPIKESNDSLEKYNSMHTEAFGGPQDGSYEILASIARGNKTIDIACGEGIIEKLAPETVGVEFSLNALKKAKINGAKYLVLADAHALPFVDNAFYIAISSGNLEHFVDPQKAINEMARVSKIQIIIVHKYPPLPFAAFLYKLFTLFLKIKHQPIENPIEEKKLLSMMKNAGLSIVYKGVWTLPVNYGRVIKFLPELNSIPSCSFVISIKK